MLDDTRVRHFGRGVVDHGIALIVWCVLHSGAEGHGAPVEAAEVVIEIAVERPGIDQAACGGAPVAVGAVEEVGVEPQI